MDQTDALNITQQYANVVNNNFESVRVFLFGSFARGNFTKDSDIDIALVFDDYQNLLDMQLELMRLRRKIDSRIEPHPFRAKDFNASNPVVNEIIKYGKEILVENNRVRP